MSKTLFFEQIVDERLENEPKEDLKEILVKRNEALGADLRALGLAVKISEPERIEFSDGIQFRSIYSVQKNTRKVTWKDVFKVVNAYKSARYYFK